MAFSPLIHANQISSHRLFTEHLYPETPWQLGRKDSYNYRDAQVRVTAVGNRTGLPEQARSYRYRVEGEGFKAVVLATWIDATAKISIENVTDPLAYNCWLRGRDLEGGYALAEAADCLAGWYRYLASSAYRRELNSIG